MKRISIVLLTLLATASLVAHEPEDSTKLHCWCSELCDFRKVTIEDELLFLAQDPNGKHLYCQRWDLNHYDERCKHERVPEPIPVEPKNK